MPWENLKPASGPQTASHLARYGTLYLLPTPASHTDPVSYWMIGGYSVLQPLAENLRKDGGLRDILTAYKVRLGRREDDVAPDSPDQQKSYGANVRGDAAGKVHTGERLSPVSKTVTEINALMALHTGRTARVNPGSDGTERVTDKLKNKHAYWDKKTPEAHHIVEFNQLEDLGVSNATGKGPLDYDQLPCVLLAAEFHQRFITRILEQTRTKKLSSPAEKRAYLQTLREVYATLYKRNGILFEPLWDAAQLILDAAAAQLKA